MRALGSPVGGWCRAVGMAIDPHTRREATTAKTPVLFVEEGTEGAAAAAAAARGRGILQVGNSPSDCRALHHRKPPWDFSVGSVVGRQRFLEAAGECRQQEGRALVAAGPRRVAGLKLHHHRHRPRCHRALVARAVGVGSEKGRTAARSGMAGAGAGAPAHNAQGVAGTKGVGTATVAWDSGYAADGGVGD